jgi:hypothetical protein
MIVEANKATHQVVLKTDRGSEIVLNWSSALLLGCMLKEASVQAEPPAPAGRSYSPSVERERR